MKVPPWDCYTVEEQRAFEQFVIFQLDELAFVDLHAVPSEELLAAMHKNSKIYAEKSKIIADATAAGLRVLPPSRSRGRPKIEFARTPFDCAVHDVKRMRAIFRKFWGKSNRLTDPKREKIAGIKWNLSDDAILKLEKRFARPNKKVSKFQ